MRQALVVDDMDEMRAVLTAAVQLTGNYDRVDSVASAEEAMDLFEKGKYELVILDIILINMSGIEAAVRMRKIDDKVILIALTGYDILTREGNLSAAGFNYWFNKPLDYPKLLKVVEKVCKEHLTNEK